MVSTEFSEHFIKNPFDNLLKTFYKQQTKIIHTSLFVIYCFISESYKTNKQINSLNNNNKTNKE